MTQYTVTTQRPDGTTFTGTIFSTQSKDAAEELGRTYAESFGYKFISLEEKTVADQKDPLKRESQQPDAQNKTAEERVEKQTIETKEVRPNKTGDVKPNS